MNTNNANRRIRATLIALIASGAACANAQTAISPPTVATMQTVQASTSPPGSRSDDAIIRDVRRAIRAVPDMVDSAIHIRAHRGVVTLTGWVPESWQISRAGNAARRVRGVRGVSNRLTAKKHHVAAIGQPLAPSRG